MKLFGQHVYPPIVVLALAECVLASAAFVVAGSVFMSIGASASPPQLLPWALAFGLSVVLGAIAVGLYQPKQRLQLSGIVIRLSAAVGIATVTLALVALLTPVDGHNLLWALSFVLSLAMLGAARLVFERFVDQDTFRRRVLLYGAGKRAASILKLRRRADQRGFKVVAFVTTPGDALKLDDERVVSLTTTLLQYAQEHAIDEIVVAMDERRQSFPIKDLLDCKFADIAVIDHLTFMERETGKVDVEMLNPAWLIFSEGFSFRPAREVALRTMDVGAAAALAALTLPVMLIVAVAILLEDGRPVLYCQRRVGLRGRTFLVYKFRSMVTHAEADGRAKWAGKEDPRITRVGRVIRKLRIDELPQLFNVLLGDMSLVGPRPERPEFVEPLAAKIPYYYERHSVKPGITGWAQLNYSYGSSERDAIEKLQLDLYYVKHRSVIFNLVVLLQTVEVVLWGKGAR